MEAIGGKNAPFSKKHNMRVFDLPKFLENKYFINVPCTIPNSVYLSGPSREGD